jgi:hypothetical protein
MYDLGATNRDMIVNGRWVTEDGSRKMGRTVESHSLTLNSVSKIIINYNYKALIKLN